MFVGLVVVVGRGEYPGKQGAEKMMRCCCSVLSSILLGDVMIRSEGMHNCRYCCPHAQLTGWKKFRVRSCFQEEVCCLVRVLA